MIRLHELYILRRIYLATLELVEGLLAETVDPIRRQFLERTKANEVARLKELEVQIASREYLFGITDTSTTLEVCGKIV